MSVIQISEFTKKVMQQINKIPAGRVATYKQIAELAGKPQGSRAVAWILHSCSTSYKLPWHRVINSKGKISFEMGTHNFRKQKKNLENEGVVLAGDGQLSLNQFQWKKRAPVSKSKKAPQIFSKRKSK
jgi:methylated-DNA-protein-cysteine methyltransferase-like protein